MEFQLEGNLVNMGDLPTDDWLFVLGSCVWDQGHDTSAQEVFRIWQLPSCVGAPFQGPFNS